MKTVQQISFLLCFFLLVAQSNAAIWRVNNQDPTADFSQLSEVSGDADVVDGDVIHVEGSTQNYGGATITKRLDIIGPGYFLNFNPNTPANSVSAKFQGSIIFSAGSEGSRVRGLVFAEVGRPNYPSFIIGVNDIVVNNCLIVYDMRLGANITGFTLTQSYVLTWVFFSYDRPSYFTASDIIANNNIFVNGLWTEQMSFSQVENNIFLNNVGIPTQYFRNNILASSDATQGVQSGNIQNNLAYNGQFGIENGNANVEENSMFVGGNSPDGQYQLQANSPAIGAGYNGTNCGIFGGIRPYALSGITGIPVIYDLRVAPQGDPVNGLQVTIKAKVN